MTREDLFEAIGGIEEDRLEQTERTYKSSHLWMRYAGVAAGICLVLVAAVAIPTVIQLGTRKSETSNIATGNAELNSDGMYLDAAEEKEALEEMEECQDDSGAMFPAEDTIESYYFQVDTSDSEYKDMVADSVYYTAMSEATREILMLPEDENLSVDDLGAYYGIVYNCENPALNGCRIYLAEKYPDDTTICIMETEDGYKLFVDTVFWYGVEE